MRTKIARTLKGLIRLLLHCFVATCKKKINIQTLFGYLQQNCATGIKLILKQFYVEARKRGGTQYSKSSLTAVRFGLCRFIIANRPDINSLGGPLNFGPPGLINN